MALLRSYQAVTPAHRSTHRGLATCADYRVKLVDERVKGLFKGVGGQTTPPMGQWPQIIVTTDDNKMHQNVAFPGIKFQNFLRRGTTLSAIITQHF